MITDHTHECRDCGADIECSSTECDWPGGTSGCPDCEEQP